LGFTTGVGLLAWFAGAWGTLLANAGSFESPTTLTPSIALFEFAASDSRSSEFAAQVRQMVKQRLSQPGSYTVSDAAGFGTNRFSHVPDFTVWQSPDVQFLVQGSTTSKDDATAIVEVRIWDVRAQKFLAGRRVQSRTDDLQGTADIITSAIRSDVVRSDTASR
jgi:hypothetical protein